jgi:MYXO-CTERM domain-containing protein
MSRLQRLSAALAFGGILIALCGFKFIDPKRKWNEEEMPIRYYLGDGTVPGIEQDRTFELMHESHEVWGEVQCSPLEFDYGGEIPNDPTFGRSDRTQTTFNGNLGTGVLAATVTHASNNVLHYNGNDFFRVTAFNIIFNSGWTWGSPEEIAAPDCWGLHSFLGVATHEIGHGLGLGHSCDSGEPCPDPILRSATMYWSGGTCDDAQDDPNEDDTAGINAIYGVAVDFDVEGVDDSSSVGPTPLTVVVSVPDAYRTERFSGYEWNFGDGSERVQLDNPDPLLDGLEHTYEAEGQYTITLTAFGDDVSCGGAFEAERRHVGAVLACSPPQPAAEFVNEGDFVVQMVNTSPLGAFGCTTEYEWVLDGDADGALRTYEPRYVFEDAGAHTVTLRAAGPGGESDVDVTITAVKKSDAGCNASVVGSDAVGGLGLLLLGLAGLLRRRD